MELYINSTWTEHYENVYTAEAVAWSENGNHATICTTGTTADEADHKLIGALRELGLVPEGITCEAEEEAEVEETLRPAARSGCLREALLSEGFDKGRWRRLAALWGLFNVPFHRS